MSLFTLTQQTGALRHAAIVSVEAVRAQVRTHHFLNQRLQLQVVVTHTPRLVHPLLHTAHRLFTHLIRFNTLL